MREGIAIGLKSYFIFRIMRKNMKCVIASERERTLGLREPFRSCEGTECKRSRRKRQKLQVSFFWDKVSRTKHCPQGTNNPKRTRRSSCKLDSGSGLDFHNLIDIEILYSVGELFSTRTERPFLLVCGWGVPSARRCSGYQIFVQNQS